MAEAIKALEFARVLTWQHRLVRVREQCHDLFGNRGWRWRLEHRSNAYVLIDPQQRVSRPLATESDQQTGTPNQGIQKLVQAPAIDPTSPLEPLPDSLQLSQQRKVLSVSPERQQPHEDVGEPSRHPVGRTS